MAAPQPGAELVPYSYTTRPTSFNGLITHDGSTGYAAEAGRTSCTRRWPARGPTGR